MTRRYIHYESAFEDFLRSEGVPYVAVDEAKRAIFGGGKVKSFDFLVYGSDERTWLADVKGRQFPYDDGGGRRYWENWVTGEDLEALASWQEAFGEPFRAAFVFAYWLDGPEAAWPATVVHPFRGRYYGFLAVSLDDYQSSCRRRSPRWDTYTMPRAAFRAATQPVQRWWDGGRAGRVYSPAARPIMT